MDDIVNTETGRCAWGNNDELYRNYHDNEWGVPVTDDRKIYEFLVLESFQAGLSWLTILKKRENFRAAFDGFDPMKVAAYDESDVLRLMADAGIIRNLLKIQATINNARRFMEVQEEFGSFSNYIWGFIDSKTVVNRWQTNSEIPAHTELSDRIAADLKKRGFKFMGSTVVYSHMQATGMVNDHLVTCFRHNQICE